MADKQVTGLDAVTAPALTDLHAVRQSGDAEDKKLTSEQLRDLILLSANPYGGRYDPLRPPSSPGSGGIVEEFLGDAPGVVSFSGQNMSTGSLAYSLDSAVLTAALNASSSFQVQFFTGPDGSATDWFFSTRISWSFPGTNNYAGIGILASGTEGSPTLVYMNGFYHVYSTGSWAGAAGTSLTTSYVSGGSAWGAAVNTGADGYSGAGWIGIGYVSASKTLSRYFSCNGYDWILSQATVLGAHPTTSFCIFSRSSNASFAAAGRFHNLRIRTDATGTTPPYPVGMAA